jgi:hypothetical protein
MLTFTWGKNEYVYLPSASPDTNYYKNAAVCAHTIKRNVFLTFNREKLRLSEQFNEKATEHTMRH